MRLRAHIAARRVDRSDRDHWIELGGDFVELPDRVRPHLQGREDGTGNGKGKGAGREGEVKRKGGGREGEGKGKGSGREEEGKEM